MDTYGIYGQYTTQGRRIANKTIRQRKQWTAYHLTTNQKAGSSTLSGRTIKINNLRANAPAKLSTLGANLGGQLGGRLIFWPPPRRSGSARSRAGAIGRNSTAAGHARP